MQRKQQERNESLSGNRTSGPCRGMTFLVGKKVTKEPTQGRMLTAKPFGAWEKAEHSTPISSRPPLRTPPGRCASV